MIKKKKKFRVCPCKCFYCDCGRKALIMHIIYVWELGINSFYSELQFLPLFRNFTITPSYTDWWLPFLFLIWFVHHSVAQVTSLFFPSFFNLLFLESFIFPLFFYCNLVIFSFLSIPPLFFPICSLDSFWADHFICFFLISPALCYLLTAETQNEHRIEFYLFS